MRSRRNIQMQLCSPQDRRVSPVFVALFVIPTGLTTLGLVRHELVLIGLGLTALAAQLRGSRLLRSSFAEHVDSRFAQTSVVVGFPARRRRRLSRMQRRWRRVATHVAALDLLVAVVLTALWLNPIHLMPPEVLPASLLLSGILLAALVGTGWVLFARLMLSVERGPSSFEANPLLTSAEIAALLEGDAAEWCAWGSATIGVCCLAMNLLS